MRYSMENTNMPVISAKDLNLWYGDFKALKGISLDVTVMFSWFVPVARGARR